jgi:hypothetical protein
MIGEVTQRVQPTCTTNIDFTYKTPARVTVARLAWARSLISNNMRMWGFKGIRSLEAKVNVLFMSITLFMDSIQIVSLKEKKKIEVSRWTVKKKVLSMKKSDKE